jgi:hypothetical protein
VFALLAIVLPACGGASRAPVIDRPAETPPGVITGATSSEVRLSTETRVIEATVKAPVSSVWKGLIAAWASLDIPVAEARPTQGSLRSPRFRVPRFANRPLHEYFDCGFSISGQRADLWEVSAEFTSAIRQGESREETRVSTAIIASARPRDGSGTQPVPCASLGRLERLIVERIQANS